MNSRAVLRLAGTGSLVALASCLGRSDGDGEYPSLASPVDGVSDTDGTEEQRSVDDGYAFESRIRRIEIDFENADGSGDRTAVIDPAWPVEHRDGEMTDEEHFRTVRRSVR